MTFVVFSMMTAISPLQKLSKTDVAILFYIFNDLVHGPSLRFLSFLISIIIYNATLLSTLAIIRLFFLSPQDFTTRHQIDFELRFFFFFTQSLKIKILC